MKHLNYAFLILMSLPLISFSQNNEVGLSPDENFVYLNNGTLLKDGDYTSKKGLLNYKYFDKNGNKIKPKNIKYHQNSKGYFGRSPYGFATRQEAGTISLFFVYHDSGDYVDNDICLQTDVEKYYFYSKGFGNLKPFTYKNLKQDLLNFPNSDFPEQEKLISKKLELSRKNKQNRWTKMGIGIGVMAAGAAIYFMDKNATSASDPLIKRQGNRKNQTLGIIVGSVGLGVYISGLSKRKSHKLLLDAMKAYNQVY